MEVINQKLKPLNPYADKVPQIKDLAKQLGVESGVLLGGVLLVGLLTTFIIFGSTILTLTITVLYPAFKSIQALETDKTTDDKEWLTYWIIFGICSLLDDFCGCLLAMIPYYYWVKLAFFVYLLAPQTRGAQFLYDNVIKGLLQKYKGNIQGLIDDVKGSAGDLTNEVKNQARNPANFVKAANLARDAQDVLDRNITSE